MKTQLDGYEVLVGDTVVDLNLGNGEVAELTGKDSFRVVFPSGRTFAYTSGIRAGVNQDVKTLYWHNPVVVNPCKNPQQWDATRGTIKEMSAGISRVVEGGKR